MSAEPARFPSNKLTRSAPWIMALGALAYLLVGAWLRRHSLDDAFINYRIVHQIEAGNGPVFNVGERVEAFTSPLWLAVLTVADFLLPFRLEWIGMVGGVLAGVAGAAMALRGSEWLHRRPDSRQILVPFGAVAFAVYAPSYRLIATGLETGLVLLWIGACCWVMGRWTVSGRAFPFSGAVLLGVGVLVRPDLAPMSAAFLGAVLIGDRRRGWRRCVVVSIATLALPVLTEIARMGYFGVLTPNTAIAKSADLSRWGLGWDYLVAAVGPYWFWMPIALVIALGYVPIVATVKRRGNEGAERRLLTTGAFALGALVCTLYIVRVGGDYMQARLLIPAFFALIAPMSFVDVRDLPRSPRVTAGILGALWIIAAVGFLRTPSDNRATLFESTNAVTLADFQKTFPAPIAPTTPPGSVHYLYDALTYPSARGSTPIVIQFGIGKVGYALPDDVYVLDVLGLANPLASHQVLRVRGYPGHEKLLSQPWIAAQSVAPGTKDVVATSFPVPGPIRTATSYVRFHRQDNPRGRPFMERVVTAWDVLECPEVQAFRASYQAPLTWHQFFANITNARRNQRFSLPGEPADAEKKLCVPSRDHGSPGGRRH